MPSIIEMRERRASLYANLKALVDRSEREHRDFTSTEQRQWVSGNAEVERLAGVIHQAEADQRAEVLSSTAEWTAGAHPLGEALAEEIRGLLGDSGAGASFTPTDFPRRFFDLLAAQSVGLRSGFTVLPTDRDTVIVPHGTSDVTSAWVAQGGTITSTDLGADTITAVPRKLAGIEAMSNEAIEDSEPALLDIVGKSLVRSVALKFDLGAYEGSGTPPEIRGLKNVSGISTVSMGTNGAIPTNLDPIADALGQLQADNAEGSAIVMHPRTWKTLAKIKEVSGSTKPILQEEAGGPTAALRRTIYGVPVFLSSQISITETQGTSGAVASSAYVYQADQVVAVLRSNTRVELDRSRLFNSDQSELRAVMRTDVVVPNPKAVVRILGILA